MEEKSPEQVNQKYLEAVKDYRGAVASALAASINLQNIDGGERRYWASVLFLRIVLIGRSIIKLCPEVKVGYRSLWWDFASVATLLRLLFESSMFFTYFIARCSEDEWLTKLTLMQLSDCTSRIRLFNETSDDEELARGMKFADELRTKLEENSFFQTLDAKLRKTLLQGYRPAILSLREIGERFNFDKDIWFYYEFLSSYTHSLPLSFYRTLEQKRFGPENDMDKQYFAIGLNWVTPMLEEVVKLYTEGYEEHLQAKQQNTNK